MPPDSRNIPINPKIPPEVTTPLSGDEIVISGISGMFPNCDTVLELKENLYNQVDMVSEINFDSFKHPNLPKHAGKLKNLHKFDAQFFRVTHWQSHSMDPVCRKVMESAFSAIYDSGINPLSISGTRLGVFVGSSYSDMVVYNLYELLKKQEFVISGSSKSMQANRVSYWIDAKAPSVTVDQGCASSMACLELAYNSMKRGDCDAALVGGCNYCVHPALFTNLKNGEHLCMDGKTKCFDKNGDGYVRSEAVNLIFLQKARDAKRIYTEIYHIKGKYFTESNDEFMPIRKSEDIKTFLQEFYSEVDISPSEVEYVECFGIGMAEADGNELEAIGAHFAKSKPIKVGCIKSNMGHTESANGVCAVTKLCLAYQKGELPPNLHYNEPLDQISAVRDGKIQVVTKNTPFRRGYSAINSFSYCGANYHVLLKGHYKAKDNTRYKTSIPWLIPLSGRNEHGLIKLMDTLENQVLDHEQIALLQNVYKINIPANTGRSYTILDTNKNNETFSLARSFDIYSGINRPVCFLYSGMGSQWCGMGTELMRIPIFAASIHRCNETLKPFGVDVVKIITSSDKTIFDNILNCMVGINAIQIGLTNVLNAMGIYPDTIIGHSIGEIGCGYADGAFTEEEAILSAYHRGDISLNTPFIRGTMAAVGLGYKDILPLCPSEVDVACHNSNTSSTLSGPADVMKTFISDLVSRGIFAKEVATSNIAYHSRYISEAGPKLLSQMRNVIPNPKLRSKKWICTSVLPENWDKEYAKCASAEYFANNLLSPVYFEENSSFIPSDAVIIEIAPHSLLQAIVKTSHNSCLYIPLTKRGCKDSVVFFLKAIGKLYQTGINPQVDVLYPKVKFPVSTETQLLSHLIEWDHSVDWPVVLHINKSTKQTSVRNVVMSIHDDDFNFMKGNIKNGINIFPESALLVLVWETLGMHQGISYKDMSVTFNNVVFHNQIKIPTEDVLRLKITIENATSRFEVINENTPIVTGIVKSVSKTVPFEDKIDMASNNTMNLNGNLLYTLLSMNGYSYSGDFQSIYSLDTETNSAYVKWTGKWAPILDSLIQLSAFSKYYDGVTNLKIINKLSIDVDEQKMFVPTLLDHVPCHKAQMFKSNDVIRCGGVEISGIVFDEEPKLEYLPEFILTKDFMPHVIENNINLQTAISMNLQVVAENVNNDKINVVELVNYTSEGISNVIKEVAANIPFHTFDVEVIDITDKDIIVPKDFNKELLVILGLFSSKKTLPFINMALEKGAFVLTLEQNKFNLKNESNYEIITSMSVENQTLMLIKGKADYDKENVIYIPIDFDEHFSWLPQIQIELKKTRRVVLVSEKQPYCGLLGFVNYLRRKVNYNIGLVFIENYYTTSFNPDNDTYRTQLRKNLSINILKKGQWGSYVYLEKPTSITQSCVSLTSTSYTALDDLIWTGKPESSKNIIKVSYAGLSARDCQKAVGKVKNENLQFGMDFSGVDKNGKKVMGLISSGALASTVQTDSTLMWPVPHHWNLQDAATVPLPYVHAYYCLVLKGEIRRNQTVFVTGGAGALGQAVISICLSLDCTIFTTVSDVQKKNFLLRLFPKLKEENIAYSRHDTFFTKVKEVTKNERCDIVINCSSGYLREAAMKCVAFIGRFLDVSDFDMQENKPFGMSYLEEDRGYAVVNVSTIFSPENHRDRKILQDLMADGIANGVVRPLSRVVYSPLKITEAFQLVSSCRHRGRVLVQMDDIQSLSTEVNALARSSFSNGSRVVICDESNLGVELVDYLIKNGSKHIIVHVKPNNNNKYLYAKSRYWHKFNITIELNSEDLGTKEGSVKLLKAAQKQAPVTGIYYIQEYKGDDKFDEIQQNILKSSFNEAVRVVSNLDVISRNVCHQLENFVVICQGPQSLSSEYAISTCERICDSRRNVGLPGLVLKTFVPNKNIGDSDDLLSNMQFSTVSKLFNTMDVSLKLNFSNVVACHKNSKITGEINQHIKGISGIKNNNGINEIATPEETNLANQDIEVQEHKLKGFNHNNICTKMSSGLEVFYNKIERNEFESFDTWIPMQTQISYYECDGYLNRRENHLMMIPGFEGHHSIFTSVAERLKILAATVQICPDVNGSSIPDMAKMLTKHIKSNFMLSEKFYILGYSFGVNIALEVAKLLEKEGRVGVIYCLDSSPEAMKTQIDAYLGNLTESQLQNNILEHMSFLMTQQRNIELKKDLEKAEDWSDKVEICMNRLRGLVQYSHDYQRNLLESAYNRIKLAKEYEPDLKLESELVLMRGIPHPRAENLAEDYNLSKYTKQPVKVFHLKSDHPKAPYDPRVSNIVNKMLDQSVLEEFSKKNLCESYYL